MEGSRTKISSEPRLAFIHIAMTEKNPDLEKWVRKQFYFARLETVLKCSVAECIL